MLLIILFYDSKSALAVNKVLNFTLKFKHQNLLMYIIFGYVLYLNTGSEPTSKTTPKHRVSVKRFFLPWEQVNF